MLSFSEWDKAYYSVNESLEDDVQNWLSRNFGGRVSKIDAILAELVSVEKEYAKKWESNHHEIFSMKDQLGSSEISEEESKDFRKKIREKKEELEDLNRKRIQKIRALNDKARSIVEGNSRVGKYWDLKKAEAELSVIENLYRVSQSFPDKDIENKFYGQYREAQEKLSQKRKGVEKISREIEKEPESKEEKTVKPGKETARLGRLISMNISDFRKEVEEYTPDQIKEIRRGLIERKNLGLNELRSLRREKTKDLDKASSKEKKDVLGRYNPKIYELGEIIDSIREKINYLND